MKSLIVITLLTGFLRADDLQSTLTFADKTSVTGTPTSANGKARELTVLSPSLDGEVTLKTGELLEMSLNGKSSIQESDHYALVTINDRFDQSPPKDTIRGRLRRLDEKTIVLDTDFAGTLTLDRLMVTSLDIYSKPPSFFNGPDGPEGWVCSSGDAQDHWVFENRSMTSKEQYGLARKVELPKRSIIRFSAKWKTSPYFKIVFLSNNGETDHPSAGYFLNLQSSYMSLYRSTTRGERDDVLNKGLDRTLRESQEADFAIYLDRGREGTSAFYINDQLIGTWTGTDDTKAMGNWLHFVPRRTAPLQFSKISVSQWDGVLPFSSEQNGAQSSDSDEFGEEPEGQRIALSNGDVIIGKIQTVQESSVDVETILGKIQIPLNRMRSIDLSNIETDPDGNEIDLKEQPKMWAEDIRAHFHDGGSVTLRLDKIENGRITGYSQVFGDATFDLNAFTRLEFNIWSKKLDPARYGNNESW